MPSNINAIDVIDRFKGKQMPTWDTILLLVASSTDKDAVAKTDFMSNKELGNKLEVLVGLGIGQVLSCFLPLCCALQAMCLWTTVSLFTAFCLKLFVQRRCVNAIQMKETKEDIPPV